jgi:hypothetical protein
MAMIVLFVTAMVILWWQWRIATKNKSKRAEIAQDIKSTETHCPNSTSMFVQVMFDVQRCVRKRGRPRVFWSPELQRCMRKRGVTETMAAVTKVCTTQLTANQNRPSCNAACANVAVQGLHNTADCKSKSPELHHCQKISPESARSDKTDKTCLSYITPNDSWRFLHCTVWLLAHPMTQDAEETGCGGWFTMTKFGSCNPCFSSWSLRNASWRCPHSTVCAGCSKVLLPQAPQQVANGFCPAPKISATLFAQRTQFGVSHFCSGTPVAGIAILAAALHVLHSPYLPHSLHQGGVAMAMKLVVLKDGQKKQEPLKCKQQFGCACVCVCESCDCSSQKNTRRE